MVRNINCRPRQDNPDHTYHNAVLYSTVRKNIRFIIHLVSDSDVMELYLSWLSMDNAVTLNVHKLRLVVQFLELSFSSDTIKADLLGLVMSHLCPEVLHHRSNHRENSKCS